MVEDIKDTPQTEAPALPFSCYPNKEKALNGLKTSFFLVVIALFAIADPHPEMHYGALFCIVLFGLFAYMNVPKALGWKILFTADERGIAPQGDYKNLVPWSDIAEFRVADVPSLQSNPNACFIGTFLKDAPAYRDALPAAAQKKAAYLEKTFGTPVRPIFLFDVSTDSDTLVLWLNQWLAKYGRK